MGYFHTETGYFFRDRSPLLRGTVSEHPETAQGYAPALYFCTQRGSLCPITAFGYAGMVPLRRRSIYLFAETSCFLPIGKLNDLQTIPFYSERKHKCSAGTFLTVKTNLL